MAPDLPKPHHRQSTRLRGYDYSQPGAYFITICTYQHQPLFGTVIEGEMVLNSFGQVVWGEWFKTAQIRSNVELFEDEFVVMPNHVHGIIWIVDEPSVGATRRVAPTITRVIPKLPCNIPASTSKPNGPKPGSIGAIIGQFKSVVTKRINRMRDSQNERVWQCNYHDRIIRDENELMNIRTYISDNPLRWSEDRYHPSITP